MFAVNRANYILGQNYFTGKNQIIAEARFLRAYYHFELVKWFGIPMKGCPFQSGMKNIPRSTVKEVYASIEADLIYASENLAALPSQREEQQKELHWLLGKAYLYQDTFLRRQLL
jgi:hypothetical protein